ncbi:MAG: hypothetical protein DRJ49_05050 [Thermoprotei archaeon]|nr:MAG: hypothetical protein DRN53_01235 [Thermoprotei archaeon]RLE88411.1 MAG: hypothetical protein DRJ49_05050 [Thermoprotei archaeon]
MGPVWINGTKPGMTLVVHIIDIQVHAKGFIKKWIVPIEKGVINFHGFKINIKLVIGVIGVAQAEGNIPGDHGGNLDGSDITIGSKVYLPIQVEGALFGVGDAHAIQGDGEVGVKVLKYLQRSLSNLNYFLI